MSQSENIGILKFFNKISSKRERKYLDYSTPRSWSQTRLPRNQAQDNQSYSPSPTTKRKRRLTELDNSDNSIPLKEQKRQYTMSSPQNPTLKSTPKEKKPHWNSSHYGKK